MDFILSYFGKESSKAKEKYREFVNAFVDKDYDSPLKDTVASTILGSLDFVNEIKDKYLKSKKVDWDLPALRELSKTSIAEIISKVKAMFSKDPAMSRKVSIYLCHRYSGATLKEIGDNFDIGESAVSQASRLFSRKLDKDRKLQIKINNIVKEF